MIGYRRAIPTRIQAIITRIVTATTGIHIHITALTGIITGICTITMAVTRILILATGGIGKLWPFGFIANYSFIIIFLRSGRAMQDLVTTSGSVSGLASRGFRSLGFSSGGSSGTGKPELLRVKIAILLRVQFALRSTVESQQGSLGHTQETGQLLA
jgi:hypothetical protein